MHDVLYDFNHLLYRFIHLSVNFPCATGAIYYIAAVSTDLCLSAPFMFNEPVSSNLADVFCKPYLIILIDFTSFMSRTF